MAEVLVAFDNPIVDTTGSYRARAVGRLADDGMWQGWIEFHPPGSPGILTTRRLTTQVSRSALYYWAGRLEVEYFEHELRRATPAAGGQQEYGATDTFSSSRTPPGARSGY